jgi:hypothetical protein
MRGLWHAAWAAIAVLTSVCPAVAGNEPHAPASICHRGELLDSVDRTLAGRQAYSQIDRATITEQPTHDPAVVRCGACLVVFTYDTRVYGARAAMHCQPLHFDVQSLTDGLRVLDVR